MIIHYEPNPLCTKVSLDASDMEKLRLKLTIEEMKEHIHEANFRLKKPDKYDVAAILEGLDVDGLYGAPFEKRLDELQKWHVDELQMEHMGDCTCVPCSCLKCRAEDLMGINTIKGLGKHSASNIHGAFSKGGTLDQAVAILADYAPVRSGAWLDRPEHDFLIHVPRWRKKAEHAHKWLLQYRQDHFPSGILA